MKQIKRPQVDPNQQALFSWLDQKFEELIIITKADFADVDAVLRRLEATQTEIKFKLSGVAYRFEVEQLEQRVQVLERLHDTN